MRREQISKGSEKRLDQRQVQCMHAGRPSVSIADQVTAINKLTSKAQASADAGAYQDVSVSGFHPAPIAAEHI